MAHGPDTEKLLQELAYAQEKEGRVLLVMKLKLTSLPAKLPSTLHSLWCYDTQITELPPLPDSLYGLRCNNTQITELPPLPNSLYELYCGNTLISELPPLPPSLKWLDCSNCPNLIIHPYENERVEHYNTRCEEWRNKKRCQDRCLTVKEELMAAAWHPRRVEKWLEIGGFELFEAL